MFLHEVHPETSVSTLEERNSDFGGNYKCASCGYSIRAVKAAGCIKPIDEE